MTHLGVTIRPMSDTVDPEVGEIQSFGDETDEQRLKRLQRFLDEHGKPAITSGQRRMLIAERR